MSTFTTGWKNLQILGVSSIRDTISGKYHSRDFMYARSEYMRVRVMLLGLIFALLTPFWALMDAWFLPSWISDYLPVRVLMLISLLSSAWLAYRGQENITLIYLLSGLVFIIPASFYAYLLLVSQGSAAYVVQGYGFIPFLLVATLSVFPFTLLESLVLGLSLLGLQAWAGLETGNWLTPKSLQDLWLLFGLLMVSLTANYFHLGLLLRLYRQATHDSLTGLLNRGALTQQVTPLLREERLCRIHVFMLDLDHFKQINDTHGHSIGDSVLSSTAALLRSICQPDCWVARYGGEEFVIVSIDRTDAQALTLAHTISERIRTLSFQNHDKQHFQVTTSIGLVRHQAGEDLSHTLNRADHVLYEAKHAGRNRVFSGL